MQQQIIGRSQRLPKQTLTLEEAERRLYGHMLERTTSESYHEQKKTYIGTIFCEDWGHFKVFQSDIRKIHGYTDWKSHYVNPKELVNPVHLDKDYLCIYYGYENKIYSPETILLIRRELNIYMRDLENKYSQEEIREWLIEFEFLDKLNELEDLELLKELKTLINKKINTFDQKSTDLIN